jgi:cyclopropane fatty-acyl-phospholipid synthase-like methyltransferase
MEKTNIYNKIYEEYSTFTEKKTSFTPGEVAQLGNNHEKYLKGWLPVDKNIRILEVGCGNGLFLSFLKSKGYLNLTGVDISSQQVKIAKQMVDNIVEDDAVNYMLNSKEKFDLIIGLDIIEHINKEKTFDFLDAACKSLTENGRLILQTPNAESPWSGQCMYGDFTHEVFFTPSLLKKLLNRTGFENVEFRETGPVVHGLFSFVRKLIWKVYWCFLAIWNLAEKGDIGSGVYTRVFTISATKG